MTITNSPRESAPRAANSPTRPNFLLSFTGLMPMVLSVPILLLQLWGLGIAVSLVTTATVVVYHLRRGQGLTSLDAVSILFSVANAILYFGFNNPVLLEHLDLVVYSLLLVQILFSLRTAEPWTVQFARRSFAPEVWSTPAFLRANRVATLLWGACFLLCDVLVLVLGLNNPLHLFAPIALVAVTALVTPRVARASVRVHTIAAYRDHVLALCPATATSGRTSSPGISTSPTRRSAGRRLLDHLERDRHNSIRTHHNRLAAVEARSG